MPPPSAHCAQTVSAFPNKFIVSKPQWTIRQSHSCATFTGEVFGATQYSTETDALIMPQRNKWNKKSGGLENCKTSYSASLASLYSSGMMSDCCFLNPKKIKYRENTGQRVGSGRWFFPLPYITLADKEWLITCSIFWCHCGFRHS